jgi:ATP-binding cassette, subfamily F, member 3
MIQLRNIEKSYGGDTILRKVNLHLTPGEKVGLIGPNGSGKTTLLRIIRKELDPDGGSVIYLSAIRTALLSQEVTVKPYYTLLQEMKRALPDIMRLERELRSKEEEMISWADDSERMEHLVEEYSTLQERFEQESGRDLLWKIDLVIQGLGFSLADRDRRVSEFSGGWHMRIELAKLLLQEVDLLLLDEPTNHLDLAATRWLEEYLKEYPGALLIVSHDRYFLNKIISRTIHIERGLVTDYSGNYDAFVVQRQAHREQQEKAYLEQQKKLEKDMRFIERFRYKARLASRVKSREKMILRTEIVEAPLHDEKTINLSFSYEESQMTMVFRFRNLEKEYSSRLVSLSGEIEILNGERIAIIGENGSGKTTLLRILGGVDPHFRGKLKTHDHAVISFYQQNQQTQLKEEHTVIESLEYVAPQGFTIRELRTILGCFLFRGDDVFKKVSMLSGGEKARLSLAQIVCSSSNVLLFDEPTNHLDIDSREALAEALKDYEGTILIVSHDRYFIDQICTRVLELRDGQLESYPGNYSYYLRKREEAQRARTAEIIPEKKKTFHGKKQKLPPSPEKLLKKQIGEVEEAIMMLEIRIKELEASFEVPGILQDPRRIQELSQEYAGKKEELERLFERYEELHEALNDRRGE